MAGIWGDAILAASRQRKDRPLLAGSRAFVHKRRGGAFWSSQVGIAHLRVTPPTRQCSQRRSNSTDCNIAQSKTCDLRGNAAADEL